MMMTFQVSTFPSDQTHLYKNKNDDDAGINDELLCYVFEHKMINILKYYSQKVADKHRR